MGVDYSSTVGYGFSIPESDIERVAENMGYEESEWGFDPHDFGWWLTQNNSLAYDHVGDLMNGEDTHLIIVASASSETMELRYSYAGGLKKFGELTITDRDQRELEETYDKIYGSGAHKEGYIGWMLAMTVS